MKVALTCGAFERTWRLSTTTMTTTTTTTTTTASTTTTSSCLPVLSPAIPSPSVQQQQQQQAPTPCPSTNKQQQQQTQQNLSELLQRTLADSVQQQKQNALPLSPATLQAPRPCPSTDKQQQHQAQQTPEKNENRRRGGLQFMNRQAAEVDFPRQLQRQTEADFETFLLLHQQTLSLLSLPLIPPPA